MNAAFHCQTRVNGSPFRTPRTSRMVTVFSPLQQIKLLVKLEKVEEPKQVG